jgi:putative tryptophan/tyrosine transport system substrate-binding protein
VIERRDLLFLLVAAALSPRAVRAQSKPAPGKVWRVGYFYFGSRQSAMNTGRYPLFIQGMRDLGYVEGKNLVIEARFADGISERLPGLATELVQLKVDVVVATGVPVYHALQKVTRTIPVVITVAADPVGEGFAASLARPGGNFTGLASGNVELFPKQIELLKIAMPKLSRIAVLWNPGNDAHSSRLKQMQAVAQKAGLQAVGVSARTAGDIESGFATMTRERAEAVITLNDTFFLQQLGQIGELTLKHRLPSVFGNTEFVDAGGLIAYGQDGLDPFRRAAIYVDKILKGAKPGDLPIEQPTKLSLVINRKTAKAIGLTIPQELLLRADRVIE